MATELWITGDPDTDRLLSEDPFALLVGKLLDQRLAYVSQAVPAS